MTNVIEYTINHEGDVREIEVKPIPYDIFKAVKPFFIERPEHALSVLIKDCGVNDDEKEEALKFIEARQTTAINSLESGFAQLISPIPAKIKKKSKTGK
jgi:hypothetical protein